MSRAIGVLVCLTLLAVSLVACLSDEDVDRLADRMAKTPLSTDDAERFVDALMAHPRYVEYLEGDEMVKKFTNAMLEHPSFQTTPAEDCATLILMAAVIAGDYSLPADSEVDSLCAWYLDQTRR